MPHQLLLDAINNANNVAGIEALKSMIINGRPSTNKYGIGQYLNGGIRSTEAFTGLAKNENIFHLLARKNLITQILPTIENALQTVAFIERENIKSSLGLVGRSLTPSTEQKQKFLKCYLTQQNASGQSPFDIASPADKKTLGAYLPEKLTSYLSASSASTLHDVAESSPKRKMKHSNTENGALSKKFKTETQENTNPQIEKIEELAKSFKDNQGKYTINGVLGTDYNNIEMFVFLNATNKDKLLKKIKPTFNSLDQFFNTLLSAQTQEDFIHQSSALKVSAVGIACKFKNFDIATKLLSYYTLENQTQLIKEAISLDSTAMIEQISNHYSQDTDWTQILFSSIKNGRHEILNDNQDHLPFDNKISIPKGSKNIEYTALNYLLHTIKLMCVRAAKAADDKTAQKYIDEKTQKLFTCFDIIANKADLSQNQTKAFSLLKQLRNFEGIYDRLAENSNISPLLENINWDEQGSTVATTVGNESIRTTQSMVSITDIKYQVTLLGDSGYDSADEADGF